MLLILSLVLVLVLLLGSVVRFKIHPFLALVVCSLVFGLMAGLRPEDAATAFLDGFGGTMRWIGVVIVLGALIGGLLNESGGTLKIADSILKAVGQKRLPFAMGITGYVVSIPAFVDVAYIMLKPVVEMLAVRSRRNVLVVGLSLTAGLTASHALLPPTPGPLGAAGILEANIGRVIVINAVVAGFAVLGGLLWATLYCGRVPLAQDEKLRRTLAQDSSDQQHGVPSRPSFTGAFAPILMPLALIAAGAFVRQDSASLLATTVRFLGTPVVALLLGALSATFLLRRGGRLHGLHGLLEKSIQSSAVVLMITGAGGGFGGVIKASGVGDAIAAAFTETYLPSVLVPFLLAMALTTATGSLTVSMVTSASVVASMLASLELSAELAAALIGAGSLCVIHANASFFWLLSRLHEVPPQHLYRTYSVQSVCMGLGGLLGALLLHLCGVD